MSDMDVGDCSTDGTCEDASSSGEPFKPMEGVKLSNLTLWEETTLAIQQFSIGKCLARSTERKEIDGYVPAWQDLKDLWNIAWSRVVFLWYAADSNDQ